LKYIREASEVDVDVGLERFRVEPIKKPQQNTGMNSTRKKSENKENLFHRI